MSVPPASRRWSEEERRLRLDALMLWWPYADGSLRQTIEALIEDGRSDGWTPEDEAQLLACAAATWPNRVAARRYAEARPDRFWEALLPRCLPTTQVLLKRLHEGEGTLPWADLLRSPQSDFALHDAERAELELLQPQIYTLLWRDFHAEMGGLAEAARRERDERRALLHGPASAELSAFEHEMMYG